MRAGRTKAKWGLLSAAIARRLAIDGSGSSFNDTGRLLRSRPRPGPRPRSWPRPGASSSLLFVVAAELEAHGRKQPVLEIGRTPRAEALEQRRRQHVRRHALLDRRLHGPATFARVRHVAGEATEL